MNPISQMIARLNAVMRPLAMLLCLLAACWIVLAMVMAWSPVIPNLLHLPKGNVAMTLASLAALLYALK